MMPIFRVCVVIALLSGVAQAEIVNSSAWINEFHYDNAGGDSGEFVEVVLLSSADINDFSVTLYNGSNGTSYSTIAGSDFTAGDSVNGYTIYTAVESGIQNGAPDGLALSSGADGLFQFLSYEGTLTATNGIANGLTSTDIGVNESGTTPIGNSLQLIGTGNNYNSFTWTGPIANTSGGENTGQSITAVPEPSAAALLLLSGLGMLRNRRRN